MTETTARSKSLYRPALWPAWLWLGLLWCASRLPRPLALALGSGLGYLSYHLVAYRRRIVETNIALCFPELSVDEQRRLVKRNFRFTGRGLIEVGFAWWRSDRFILNLSEIRGLEHLRKARGNGQGVLLLGAHWTMLDLLGRILSVRERFGVIYREHRNPVIEHVMRTNRDRSYGFAFDRKDMRSLIRGLREGKVVWYPPDQDNGRRHSVFAPLFGIQAATITVPGRVVRATGVPVLPVLGYFDGERYVVEVHEPLSDFPSGDEVADATRLNRVLEDAIRRHPDQYYWVHRRFKTRPEGKPSPYPPRR